MTDRRRKERRGGARTAWCIAWISIAAGFLAITKQEIRSKRERRRRCASATETGTGTEGLFGSEAKYSERTDRVRVTVN